MIRIRVQPWRTGPLLALFCLIALVALGCDTTSSNPDNSNNPNVPAAPTVTLPPPPTFAPPPINPPPNQKVTVGTWTIALDQVGIYSSLPNAKGGDVLKPKNAYIAVRMKATNSGTAAAHLDLTDFQLIDSAGKTYTPDANAVQSLTGSKKGVASPAADVAPAASSDWAVAFDAPPDLPAPQLVIKGTARFQLQQ